MAVCIFKVESMKNAEGKFEETKTGIIKLAGVGANGDDVINAMFQILEFHEG